MPTLASLNVEVGADIKGLETNMGRAVGVIEQAGKAASEAGNAFSSSLANGFEKAGQAAIAASGRYVDTTGKLREANGRFVSAATLAAEVTGKFGDSLDQAGNKALSFNQKLVSGFAQYDKVFDKLDQGIGRFGRGLKDVGQSLSTYVTAPLTLFGIGAVKTAGDTEALKKGLEAVTGSAEKAGTRFKELQELSKLPGLGLEQAVEADISLQATGLAAETSAKSIKQFGNAIASVGKGPEQLKQALYGVQQLANTDFPLGEDLNIIKESVPQVTKLLKDAFGTARSEELQKLGVSSQEVLNTILIGLEKLPRVAGGINNTFTNVFDGLKQNLSRFGESITKNFNIEALAGKFSAVMDGITNAFTNLSPPVQKGILLFAGLAAAAGPLTFAIGGIISALPTLAAGFAVVTGPIGIAAAAIAGAAVLITTNWDAVVAYFQSSGLASVFEDLKNSVTGSLSALVDYVQDFAAFVKPVWDGVVEIFSTGIGEGLRFAGTVLSAGFDLLKRILNVGVAVLRGDWQAVWEGIGNVVISVLNGITRIFTGFVSGTIKVVGSLGKAINIGGFGEGFSKSLNQGAAAVEKFGKSLLLPYLGNEKLVESNKAVTQSFQEVAKAAELTFTRTPKGAKGKAPKKLTKEQIGIDDPIYHTSTTGFKKAIAEIEKQNDAAGNKQGFEVPIKLAMPQNVAEQFAKLKESIVAGMTNINGVVVELSGLVQSSLGEVFTTIGETLGQALSGNFQGLQSFFDSFMSIVFDFAGQLGKVMIGLGLARISLAKIGMSGVGAVVAGTALVALAGAAKGLFAKGPNLAGAGGGSSYGGATGSGATGTPRSTYISPTTTASLAKPSSIAGKVEFEVAGSVLRGVLRNEQYTNYRST